MHHMKKVSKPQAAKAPKMVAKAPKMAKKPASTKMLQKATNGGPGAGTIELYQTTESMGDKGTWRWRLKANNGKTVADSAEAYVSHAFAIEAARNMLSYSSANTNIVELPKPVPAPQRRPRPSPQPTPPSSPAAPDTTPPLVMIMAPGDGTSVSNTIEVKVRAEDANGVKQVELRTDGTSRGFSSTPVDGRYRFMLDTKIYKNGQHTLTAVATDNVGNSATSAAVGINVQNQ